MFAHETEWFTIKVVHRHGEKHVENNLDAQHEIHAEHLHSKCDLPFQGVYGGLHVPISRVHVALHLPRLRRLG